MKHINLYLNRGIVPVAIKTRLANGNDIALSGKFRNDLPIFFGSISSVIRLDADGNMKQIGKHCHFESASARNDINAGNDYADDFNGLIVQFFGGKTAGKYTGFQSANEGNAIRLKLRKVEMGVRVKNRDHKNRIGRIFRIRADKDIFLILSIL